jgi:pectin methylesterase-like acyl-CoA thioesterase
MVRSNSASLGSWLAAATFALAAIPGTVAAGDWYVCANMGDAGQCSHTDLQAAVDYADSGDIIHVGPGAFPGPVTVQDKSLTIAGSGESRSSILLDRMGPAIVCSNSSSDPDAATLNVSGLSSMFSASNGRPAASVQNDGCKVNGRKG